MERTNKLAYRTSFCLVGVRLVNSGSGILDNVALQIDFDVTITSHMTITVKCVNCVRWESKRVQGTAPAVKLKPVFSRNDTVCFVSLPDGEVKACIFPQRYCMFLSHCPTVKSKPVFSRNNTVCFVSLSDGEVKACILPQ